MVAQQNRSGLGYRSQPSPVKQEMDFKDSCPGSIHIEGEEQRKFSTTVMDLFWNIHRDFWLLTQSPFLGPPRNYPKSMSVGRLFNHRYPNCSTGVCKGRRIHSLRYCSSRSTYLSTNVRITARVSSTNPSTLCFFLLGSCGPRPLRGGLTGSRRWLLASGAGILLLSAWWLWDSVLSSAPLSSRHTQELPMLLAPRVCSKHGTCCTKVSRKPWRRLLLT